CQQFTSSPWTF
nr:immunoglobulin light chain junction region [Mus musculus]NSL97445.1 immunoglobulin light chain junction region [Mus musculus]NSL97767.1 immunoglobulin light chain junction region [Mus musculus]NSL97788.1 immunoglobulin light chain junction region [Mus musculus]NSL98086.1 immunoglobulin light chain junction region [Mus musculus]